MKKQNFNLHTHTARCGHAEGLDEQYIQSAIEAGFTTLGFSEHIPYVEMRLPSCRMYYEHATAYLSDIRWLKLVYEKKIDIKVGYEVEYMDDYVAYLRQMRKDCDYMILGQHCKYIGYEYDCYCNDEDVLEYARQVDMAMQTGLITYVAHPDYYMMGRRTFSKACEKAAHRIALASITYDIPLEVNLNGFHYGKKRYYDDMTKTYEERYPYPFRDFWEIIAEYGCKVVYGYDAHSPSTLLERDREQIANEILEGIHLNYVSHITIR